MLYYDIILIAIWCGVFCTIIFAGIFHLYDIYTTNIHIYATDEPITIISQPIQIVI